MRRCCTCYPPKPRNNTLQHRGCKPDKRHFLPKHTCWKRIVGDYAFKSGQLTLFTNAFTCKAQPLLSLGNRFAPLL